MIIIFICVLCLFFYCSVVLDDHVHKYFITDFLYQVRNICGYMCISSQSSKSRPTTTMTRLYNLSKINITSVPTKPLLNSNAKGNMAFHLSNPTQPKLSNDTYLNLRKTVPTNIVITTRITSAF